MYSSSTPSLRKNEFPQILCVLLTWRSTCTCFTSIPQCRVFQIFTYKSDFCYFICTRSKSELVPREASRVLRLCVYIVNVLNRTVWFGQNMQCFSGVLMKQCVHSHRTKHPLSSRYITSVFDYTALLPTPELVRWSGNGVTRLQLCPALGTRHQASTDVGRGRNRYHFWKSLVWLARVWTRDLPHSERTLNQQATEAVKAPPVGRCL